MRQNKKSRLVMATCISMIALIGCGGEMPEDDGDDNERQTTASTYYAAKPSNTGGDCGASKYCRIGDLCTSKHGQCKRVTACNAIYSAGRIAHGGPACGKKTNGFATTYYGCRKGDYCASAGSRLCRKVTPCGCNAYYHSASSGHGHYCGVDKSSGYKKYLFCERGDYCQSRGSKLCRKTSRCKAGTLYHAGPWGAGAKCGTEYVGHHVTLKCEKTDTCHSPHADLCRKKAVPKPVIVDNGKAGTSRTGQWYRSGLKNPWGPSSLFTKKKGNKYIWKASLMKGEKYRVKMWWTASSNRDRAAKIRIYDGSKRIYSGTANQRTRGSRWVGLNKGRYFRFNSGKGKVVIERSGQGTATSADAVRFQP